MQLRDIRDQLGGTEEFFALFGGRRAFDTAHRNAVGKNPSRALTSIQLEHYLKYSYGGQSPAMINSSSRLPNVTHTKAMTRIIATLTDALPEPRTSCTPSHRALAKAAIDRVFAPPATLFGSQVASTADDDPSAPSGLE